MIAKAVSIMCGEEGSVRTKRPPREIYLSRGFFLGEILSSYPSIQLKSKTAVAKAPIPSS